MNGTVELPADHQGWYHAPNLRGTWDIIRSCAVTIFLCSWSAICLNVEIWTDDRPHSRTRHFLRTTRSRGCLMLLAILAPESNLTLAIGQYCEATRSKNEFHSLKSEKAQKWTRTHGFYASAGGFVLETADYKQSDGSIKNKDGCFVLTAYQLFWLIEQQVVSLDAVVLEREELESKNKIDLVARIVTGLQTGWFVLNLILRKKQNLHITPLEITTLGFILCATAVFLLWWKKPGNCDYPNIISTAKTLEEIIRLDARLSAYPSYTYTPLDPIRRPYWAWNFYWSFWTSILKRMHLDVWRMRTRPSIHLFDDNFPEVDSQILLTFLVVVASLCVASSMLVWYDTFPTIAERWVWRVASVISLAALLMCWFLDRYWNDNWYDRFIQPFALHIIPRRLWMRLGALSNTSSASSSHPNASSSTEQALPAGHKRSIRDKLRNFSVPYDPDLGLPLRRLLPITMGVATYCFCRGIIVALDFASLRSQPASTYDTPQYFAWWPHF